MKISSARFHYWLTVLSVCLFFCFGISSAAEPQEYAPRTKETPPPKDYDQWKNSLGASVAVDPATLKLPPGFQVELLRSAGPEEGSWVSIEFDDRGRLIVAREDKGLLRFTLPSKPDQPLRVETINDTLLECRGLLWAYDSLYANANNSKGLYHLRDTNGDDHLNDVRLLKATGGNVGHGRNDLALGLDGMIYAIHGNDVRLPDDFQSGASPYRDYRRDRLLPCQWNSLLFNAGVTSPAGHVIRTDRDGKTWELVAGGFRNPYGIDFNVDGEMFTYDADMEWDVGAPWYRPTRVNHIVSGGEYGWRQGTDKWPAYYPDSLPSTVDIGLGSPTGIKFGYKSHFPPRYRRALYILDWAYGRIIAVHMTPHGASYIGHSQEFIKGQPLNVTDLDFGPDGSMVFTTGGRRTQSGLYRVRYVGPKEEEYPSDTPIAKATRDAVAFGAFKARQLRRRLEAFHGSADAQAITVAWPHLDSEDRWIRFAARVAIESQSVNQWQDRALGESRPRAAGAALLALARVGPAELQQRLLARVGQLPLEEFDDSAKLTALRTTIVCLSRMGRPELDEQSRLLAKFDPLYPSRSSEVNQQLCELLVYLQAASVVEKTLPLLDSAQTQSEKLHYLFTLRLVKTPWTLAQRGAYLQWLHRAEEFKGARDMPMFLKNIKIDTLATFSSEEHRRLAALLAKIEKKPAPPPVVQRPFVKHWKLDDLAASLDEVGHSRNYDRGRQLFTAAMCERCHRLAGKGELIGPELTEVARRFNRRDMLLSLLEPSRVVAEKYRNLAFETDDGQVIIGRLVGDDGATIQISTDPLQPDKIVKLAKSRIEFQSESLISSMPEGLLDTLSREEILDLLAYLEAAGQADRANFQPK